MEYLSVLAYLAVVITVSLDSLPCWNRPYPSCDDAMLSMDMGL